MAVGWVRAFDQSKARVPISRMQEAYDAGYRVAGFYAGGGSPDKWPSHAEVDAWLSRPGTGVAGLFEIYGTEPINFPSRGATHARTARSAWRAYGYPDSASIFAAVDEDVTLTQTRDQLTAYFRNWMAADTCKPVPYVEADAGAILVAEGLTAGTFTPAAWEWNSPATLYTPDNAPGHVLWTQEHNGRALYGGDLDIGHIRTTAPIWWRDGQLGDVGVTGMDEQSIAAAVWAYKQPGGVNESLGGALSDERAALAGGSPTAILTAIGALSAKLDTVLADEVGEAAAVAVLSGKLDGVPAAVVAALPSEAGGATFTPDQLAQIETAAQTALGHLGLAVAP